MAKLTREQIREGLKQIPMEEMLLGKGTQAKLTKKQLDFVKGVAEGKPKAQAYKDAYNSKGKAKTRANSASKLASRPDINMAIEAEKVRKSYAEYRNATQMREHILERLYMESIDEDSPPSARIQALSLLGKVAEVSLFEERKTTTVIHQKSSDIEAELMKELKGFINVEATEVKNKEEEDSLLIELQQAQQEEEKNKPSESQEQQAEGFEDLAREDTTPPPPRIDPSAEA